MSGRILVAEDDPVLARGLCDNFRDEGYEVHHVDEAAAVLPAVKGLAPDLLVLDLTLKRASGLDVLRSLRGGGHERLPVLVLTAKGDVVDRIVGLELGADDYVAKPFVLRELLARVRALLRRSRLAPAGDDVLSLGDVRFDFVAMTATGPEGKLDVPPHAVRVLKVLAARRGEVVSRLDIVEEVSGLDSESTARTVDNHVMALRRALGEDPRSPRLIETVRGVGYRLRNADGC